MTNSKKEFSADLKALLRVIPDIYLILDTDLHIVDASEKFLKTTMVTAEQIIGKHVFEIFPDNDQKLVSENKIRESFNRVIEKKIPDTVGVIKYDIRKPESEGGEYEERYWSVINTPILDKNNNVLYILNRSEDVTNFIKLQQTDEKQKSSIEKLQSKTGQIEKEIYNRSQEIQQTNIKLREALDEISRNEYVKSKLAAIVEATDDAVVGISPNGTIASWNKGAEKLYGYTAEEVVGQLIKILYPEDRYGEFDEVLRHIKEDKPFRLDTERMHKDGHLIAVSLSNSSIKDKDGQVIGACNIARDISEFKKITRLKNEFISIVSHELRTPLTSIQGSLSLLVSGTAGQLPEDAMKLLQIGKQNSERLIRLINDILDIDKIESGKMEFKLEPLHIDLITREAIFANESFGKKFNVKINVTQNTNNLVNVDKDRFLQVLTNIISNAIKFSTPGTEVNILVQKKRKKIQVLVSNKGPGIPKEFHSKIFEKFVQANVGSSRSYPGTGLGLSISKEIMAKLGGNISFVSEPNKETIFCIELPVYESLETKKQFNKVPLILICEDDIKTANYLRVILEQHSFKVLVARSIIESKHILADQQVDALLLDLVVSDQDGISFIKDLRKHYSVSELPIVVISVEPQKGQKELNGNAISVLDWIEKPIDLSRLLETIKHVKNQIEIKTPNILHIEDDQDLLDIIANLLLTEANVSGVTTLAHAREILKSNKFDLVILDLMLPDGSGIELLPLISKKHMPVIVFSAYDLPKDYSQYVVKTLLKSKASPHELLENITNSLLHKKLPLKQD